MHLRIANTAYARSGAVCAPGQYASTRSRKMEYGKIIKSFEENGRLYRLVQYEGLGVAREVYSNRHNTYHHECWGTYNPRSKKFTPNAK